MQINFLHRNQHSLEVLIEILKGSQHPALLPGGHPSRALPPQKWVGGHLFAAPPRVKVGGWHPILPHKNNGRNGDNGRDT